MNRWFACHHQSRLLDAEVRFHFGHCTPCFFRAWGLYQRQPDYATALLMVKTCPPDWWQVKV